MPENKEVIMAALHDIKYKIKILAGMRKFSEAINLLQEHLDSYAGEGCLYYMLGDLYAGKGEIMRALSEYERAVFVYWGQGYYPNAIMLCKKILRMNPESASTYRVLSRIQGDLGQYLTAAQNRARFLLHDAGGYPENYQHLEEIIELLGKSMERNEEVL